MVLQAIGDRLLWPRAADQRLDRQPALRGDVLVGVAADDLQSDGRLNVAERLAAAVLQDEGLGILWSCAGAGAERSSTVSSLKKPGRPKPPRLWVAVMRPSG